MAKKNKERKARSIIELSCDEARDHFLKQESYFNVDLPPYFVFDDLLNAVAKMLKGKRLSDFQHRKPRNHDNVNYFILNNKDGRYAWRPMQLIHPALYVSLVENITECQHWETICNLFTYFDNTNPKIRCLSLPLESLTDQKDRAELVSKWWRTIEQKSIELSLEFGFLVRTDIVDCYAAIYTHSIAWAIHTKQIAKDNRDVKTLIGNIIDNHIQEMQQGQTNGIPQGSVLMDLIAEMVLGYADTELTNKLASEGIENYQILRYRDDYRIFVNNSQDGEIILKCLTEVMNDLGLKLNPIKTDLSDEVVRSSVKPDKLDWMFRRQGDSNLQKTLMIIHDHSREHPHSGSLQVALQNYHRRTLKARKCDSPMPLISIIVDIAYNNPRTYPAAMAILSKLLTFVESTSERREIVRRIVNRFSRIPNTGHLEIWLQRITREFGNDIDFQEPLCQLVSGENNQIWNNDWIRSKKLLDVFNKSKIIDQGELNKIDEVIPIAEIELFTSYY